MQYIIQSEDVGKRLDIFISEKNQEITRSYIKKIIEEENILVNDKKVKSGYALKKNDEVSLNIPEDRLLNITAEEINLDIIHEDEDIIIINKAKGMVVHPANGNYTGTLVNSLMYSHSDKLSSINGTIRPGIVHRIDKDTTGVLVIAKNDKAHKNLSEQFKQHSINRVYVAIVKGIIKDDEFSISLPIGRNERDRKKMAVTYKNSREATTHIKVLKRFYSSNMTLIEARLETGRTHQIRVHMSYLGHPLLGDETYSKKETKFKYKVRGHMLHAKVLGFNHPKDNKYVEYEKDLPDEFKKIIDVLEKKEQ